MERLNKNEAGLTIRPSILKKVMTEEAFNKLWPTLVTEYVRLMVLDYFVHGLHGFAQFDIHTVYPSFGGNDKAFASKYRLADLKEIIDESETNHISTRTTYEYISVRENGVQTIVPNPIALTFKYMGASSVLTREEVLDEVEKQLKHRMDRQ